MSGVLRFADYELDLDAYALRRHGQTVRLEKMPMEVLILLVQRPGALLSRSDIHAALWGADVFVDRDAAINTAIRKIRRALRDDPAKPQFVETVVGKGYRFVAAVESDAHSGSRSLPSYLVTRGRKKFVLSAGEMIFGRDPAAQVCIDHPSVSRRHAVLSIGANGTVLRDLGSRNGTFLNGQQVDRPVKVASGAIIGLGPVMLTFVVVTAMPSTESVSAL